MTNRMGCAQITPVAVEVDTRWPDGRTNAYLLGRSPTVLVDPPAVAPSLTKAIQARDVDHIAVTHTHGDHVGGVSHYAEATGATVWARYGRIDRFVTAADYRPDRTFQEGTSIGHATVVDTPGHSADHVAFHVEDAAVVGDLAVQQGSVLVGSDGGDLRAYLVSLRRLRQADLDRLFPGHGPVIEAPNETLDRLLRHRLLRERRVLEAVEAGARDLQAVTEAAYDKDLTGVTDLARQTVATHLAKLDFEGRIDWNGARAIPTDAPRRGRQLPDEPFTG